MRSLALLLFASLTVTTSRAQSAAVPADLVLQVSIASQQREFHIGETIPLELAFSSTAKDRYEINKAQYDRSGRMAYEQFNITPAGGAVDPLPRNRITMLGGLTNFQFLTPDPWKLKLNLNEWIRFTQPGEYQLIVSSNRVAVRDLSNPFGTSPVAAQSNGVRLKIIRATALWRKQVFDQAVRTIEAATPTKAQELEQYRQSRRQAFETLRFLGTPEAIRALAKLMRGEDSGGLDSICMLGIISAPDLDISRKALEKELADPDHPIGPTFFYTLNILHVAIDDEEDNWREGHRKSVEELVAALPRKRGKALVTSLNTATNEAWNGAMPKEISDQLAKQLVSAFDQLSTEEQRNLLTYRWDKIGGPQMLPILRRYAQAYQDFPQMREGNAYTSRQLSASALQHWYQLDPAGARPAIINEITRPRPRYDARVLGLLSDKTLPEVDFVLAEHFVASTDPDGSVNLASLIARYSTDAVLSKIITHSDPLIGKWGCAIQDSILAYILRVSPELARPRIEQALAARGEAHSGCSRELFQMISEIHYDPVLEEIGLQSLNDPDPMVAATAATMLGKFGSPAAEPELWRRYASWNEKWKGRESELDMMRSEYAEDRMSELGLGQNLAQALATGKSWLCDGNSLRRLLDMTHVKRVRDQLETALTIWDTQPLTITLNNNPPPAGAEGHVAQYSFDSLDALKTKLRQFQAGTKFILSTPSVESPASEKSKAELREFLSSHGMAVAEEKAAH